MPKDDLNIPIPETGSEEPLKKRMKITDDDGHELNGECKIFHSFSV